MGMQAAFHPGRRLAMKWPWRHIAQARVAIAGARDSLLARAAKIADPAWRARFLRDVPTNARTLAQASWEQEAA
jgi:hypothetical protein